MRALILIGGEGTRLRPLTLNTLKCTAPIVNRPFFMYQFDLLKKYGVKEVILSICHMPDKIKKYIGTGKKYDLKIIYVQEKKPLGTGGAIKNAEKFLSEDTIVMNGDVLTDVNLKKMLSMHKRTDAIATIMLNEVMDPSAYGLVQTDGIKITKFIEKPSWADIQDRWINAGIYIFNKRVLNYIPAGKNVSLEREVFPKMINNGEVLIAYKSKGYWIDIGKIDKYRQVNFDLLENRFKTDVFMKQKKYNNEVYIGKNTKIDKDASLRGPIVIGNNCIIKSGTYEPLVIIGNNCKINENVVIEKSILWDNIHIGKNVSIKNSIIGNGCIIKDNSILNEVVLGDNTVITEHSKLGHK
ncbi:MAG: NDP-sugar synthase [Candidatus Goldbacteria bacterium]|nr:NDP-sugar synthase [Candidatus Goldiibacteriota bacterium]